jgi:hypothetical protein
MFGSFSLAREILTNLNVVRLDLKFYADLKKNILLWGRKSNRKAMKAQKRNLLVMKFL